MGARLSSWWQQIKRHRVAILVVAVILALAVTLIILEIRVYGVYATLKKVGLKTLVIDGMNKA